MTSNLDIALLFVALVCCVLVVARAGDARTWAVIAGAALVAVLIGATA